tara:strand:- start:393 stop:899 length:507 start_codon:yes stop_codon:yes gene_type:complete
MNSKKLSYIKLDAIIFDFDGVLTNNKVYIDSLGNETVECSRGDGLAFDVLNKIDLQTFIISSEKNKVVEKRAKKLKVKCYNGIKDKEKLLDRLVKKNKFNFNKIMFVGNDLNDFSCMKKCGFSACPADSHSEIKKISKIILKSKGGDNIVREIVEDVLKLNLLKILYN